MDRSILQELSQFRIDVSVLTLKKSLLGEPLAPPAPIQSVCSILSLMVELGVFVEFEGALAQMTQLLHQNHLDVLPEVI